METMPVRLKVFAPENANSCCLSLSFFDVLKMCQLLAEQEMKLEKLFLFAFSCVRKGYMSTKPNREHFEGTLGETCYFK